MSRITPEAKEQGMLFAKAIFRNVDGLGAITTAHQFFALLRIIACRPAWTEEEFLRFMADDTLVMEAEDQEACPDALLPDGPTCPRSGQPRGPSGVDGGSWIHMTEAGLDAAEEREARSQYDGDGPVEDDDGRHAPDTREEAKGEK